MLSFLSSLPQPIVRSVVGIWRHRWLAVSLAWAAAVLGWVMVSSIPDLYESRAQVYINTDTALDSTISDVGVRPNLEKGVRIIRRQLMSRDNMERLIYSAGLDGDIESEAQLQRKIDRLATQIDVQMAEEGYFTFRYAHRDPQTAQRVVASLLDLFIEQNLQTASADVNRAMQNLDRELTLRRVELDEIDNQITDFRRSNASELAGTQRQSRLLDTRLAELGRIEDQIALAEARAQRLRSALTDIPKFSSGGDVDRLKLELATLQSQFTDTYPDIVRLKAQIAELESNSANLPDNPEYTDGQRALTAANDEISSLRARRGRIQGEVDQLTLDAAETPEAEAQLEALMRERDRIEATYLQLSLQRTRMDVSANLNQGGGAIDYTRFEAPKVAAAPVWPPRGLFMIAIAVLATGGGLGLVLLLTFFDRTYTQPSDLEKSLGLPVLGGISPAPTDQKRFWLIGERAGLLAAVAGLFIVAAGLSWLAGHSFGAESGETVARTEVGALAGLR
ncbi:MAG: XrtA system polysaccharide chain length determinant [Pseudomonadota bacterium]